MAKKSKTVKIKIDQKTEKGFTVTELTVAQIIDLTQQNPLFGATLNDNGETAENNTKNASEGNEKEDSGLMNHITDASKSIQQVIKISCDFEMEDLKALAPSDIELIFNDWREVNQTFLTLLEKMGIIEAAKAIIEKAMSDFLRIVAI